MTNDAQNIQCIPTPALWSNNERPPRTIMERQSIVTGALLSLTVPGPETSVYPNDVVFTQYGLLSWVQDGPEIRAIDDLTTVGGALQAFTFPTPLTRTPAKETATGANRLAQFSFPTPVSQTVPKETVTTATGLVSFTA